MEERKDIPWYEWLYQVSNMGRIKSLPRKFSLQQTVKWNTFTRNICTKEKIKDNKPTKFWYIRPLLVDSNGWYKRIFLHRLVYYSFNGWNFIDFDYHKKCLICHRDDNKTNNRLDNLFIWTYIDNNRDCLNKWRANRCKWINKYNAVLNEDKVRTIIKLHSEWMSDTQISKISWIHQFTIRSVTHWKTRKHIEIKQ